MADNGNKLPGDGAGEVERLREAAHLMTDVIKELSKSAEVARAQRDAALAEVERLRAAHDIAVVGLNSASAERDNTKQQLDALVTKVRELVDRYGFPQDYRFLDRGLRDLLTDLRVLLDAGDAEGGDSE